MKKFVVNVVNGIFNWWYSKDQLKAKLEVRGDLLNKLFDEKTKLEGKLSHANGVIVKAADICSALEAKNKTLKFKNTKLSIRNTVLESKVM